MNDIREEIDAALAQTGEVRKIYSEFFRFIGDTDVEDVKAVLGRDLGSFLHGLCPVLNLLHPDLQDVLGYCHVAKITQAIEAATFARKRGYVLLHQELFRVLKPEIKDIEDKIRLMKMCARLLQRGEKEAARLVKSTQAIDLTNAYRKWSDNIPLNFDLYVRHNMAYKAEIEKFEKQAEHFKRLGCESMCAEIKKSLDVFQESFGDTHYGFRRITMTLIALILGKMHGCSISSNYVPAAYPAHLLDLPDRIKNAIGITENFPEAAGNPIFDYYIVVSPKIDTPGKLSESIADKSICPVLLGERDGKCYFISIF
ncbi:MAG: hypothetical protein M0R80_01640 [Proteobacteria bacterium]|jgi:hypothetical protein|nr:hypothetical protein [Pseudomonadota bacterium]